MWNVTWLEMPFYDEFVFEQLRHFSSSKCHQCGDVYSCIKCQKELMNRNLLLKVTRDSSDDDIKRCKGKPVDRSTLQDGAFVVSVLRTLVKDGFCVVENLVPLDLARKTLEEMQSAYETPGKFMPGKLSNGAMNRVRSLDGIRGDSVMWLDGTNEDSALISQVTKQMNKLALSLYHANSVAMNRVSKSKVMVSCYDGNGKAYKRHIDSARDGSLKLTFIYYLNKDYDAQQGGCLRIHSELEPIDIPPELGKLVIFRSDKLIHEVLPTFNRRFAFTIWYMEVPKRKAVKPEVEQETDKLAAETSPRICLNIKRVKTESEE